MHEDLLRQLQEESDAAQSAGEVPAGPIVDALSAMAQSAELLGQAPIAPAGPAEAQSAELSGQAAAEPDPFELPPWFVGLMVGEESEAVLGPVEAAETPGPEVVERVVQAAEVAFSAPAGPLETIPEEPEAEAAALRGGSRLATIPEEPEAEAAALREEQAAARLAAEQAAAEQAEREAAERAIAERAAAEREAAERQAMSDADKASAAREAAEREAAARKAMEAEDRASAAREAAEREAAEREAMGREEAAAAAREAAEREAAERRAAAQAQQAEEERRAAEEAERRRAQEADAAPARPTIERSDAASRGSLDGAGAEQAAPSGGRRALKRADAAARGTLDVVDTAYGPGVASSAQGPIDTAAHIMTAKRFEAGRFEDAQFSDTVNDVASGMSLATGGASALGGAARMGTGAYKWRDGAKQHAAAKESGDLGGMRQGKAGVRGGRTDVAQGTGATAGASLGLTKGIIEAGGQTASAGLTIAGPAVAIVGGTAQMVRHARKGHKASKRYKALEKLKGRVQDADLEKVRAYAAHKNFKAKWLQRTQAAGGALGAGGGAAGVAVAAGAAATAATPVGWALLGAAAGLGLGVAGYAIVRKMLKKDPDQRTRMAALLQSKLMGEDAESDDAARIGREDALLILEALGVAEGEAHGPEGLELLMRKMRTS